jgi:poly(3-hydroxybutyrate) depolymerase
MLYYLYEMQRLWAAPVQLMAEAAKVALNNPFNPVSHTPAGKIAGSAVDMIGHFTQRYGKPEWGIDSTEIDGRTVAISIEKRIDRTYCDLLHFRREEARNDPKLLILAPLSGHYATLVRGTVEAMLPDHDVYVSDWKDASMIPAADDRFDLDDYIDYLVDFLHALGPNTHVLAVCQPAVPAFAATALMAGWGDNCVPASLTMIGGPIDTRKSPTQVNLLAKEHDIAWFERNVVVDVPPPYPGAFRKVYPGFIQLTNFIAMNFDRHVASYHQLFQHLVQGDDDAADRKRAFYEEYRSVMDLPAEFYLQTVKTVFQDHLLPKGEMVHRWHPVLTEKITETALMCIEGELDDISGIGQTKAALEITPNLPDSKKEYLLQEGVGHYGVFNGGKWRREIAPRVKQFIRTHDQELSATRFAAD